MTCKAPSRKKKKEIKKVHEMYTLFSSQYKYSQIRTMLRLVVLKNETTIYCKFNLQRVKARLSKNKLHLICTSPRSHSVGATNFRIVVYWKDNRWPVITDRRRSVWKQLTAENAYNIFYYYSTPRLLTQISSSTEVGGEVLQLQGVNFTGNVAYELQIGEVKVSGLWDAFSQSIITKAPPLIAGIVPISISANRQNMHYSDFFHVVFFHTCACQGYETSSNSVVIFYAGTKDNVPSRFLATKVEIKSVKLELASVDKEGSWLKSTVKLVPVEGHGRYRWKVEHEVQDESVMELHFIRFT